MARGIRRAEAQRQIDDDLAGAHRWFNTEIVGVPAEVVPAATAKILPDEWHGVDDASLTDAIAEFAGLGA